MIWVTHCCQSKAKIVEGTPRKLYIDAKDQNRLKVFWQNRDWLGKTVKAAILSYKYGLVWENEIIDNYDLSAKDVPDAQRKELAKMIRAKVPAEEWLLYYAKHPFSCQAFGYILSLSAVPHIVIYSITTLPKVLNEYFLGYRDESLKIRKEYKKKKDLTDFMS